jgi:hypothetical protein
VRRLSLRRPSAATVISLVALFFAMGGTAVAATGGNFILGKANTATTVSSLANTKGTALSLSSTATTPPLTVSNSVQVPKLNASELDGQTSTAFLSATGTAANSSELGGQPPSAFLSATGTAANSSELGGQSPSFYLPATGTAENSSELGGLPASSYGDRAFAVVAADGTLVIGPAVSSTQFDGTGSYDVRFTGTVANSANCAVFVQLMSGIGWATAGPGSSIPMTEFDVHIFNTAGNAADAEFSLYAIC